MLTSNDIANVKFDRIMGRGYKMEEVDSYVRQTADFISSMENEKKELEQKLMVLADKLEEYKRDEDSLRSALVGAQKLGDSVIRDAKSKAQAIIEDAGVKAGGLVDNAHRIIEREQNGFIRMKREVATFKSKLQLLYKQHLELISSIPSAEFEAEIRAARAEESIERPVSVAEEVEPQESEADYENQEEYENDVNPDIGDQATMEFDDLPEEDEEDISVSRMRESRFGPLKFGKEFDIKRDSDKRRK